VNDRCRWAEDQGECQIYRTEAELYVAPGTGRARIRRNTVWFDKLGQVQSQEETEWEGPVSTIMPDEQPKVKRVGRVSKRRHKVRLSRPNRVVDMVILTAVVTACFAAWRLFA
jgi:hypothetical protein